MLVKAERAGQWCVYLTDIVGIHFSLDELRQVCWQVVLMQDFLPFGFVSDLGDEKPCVTQVWRDS